MKLYINWKISKTMLVIFFLIKISLTYGFSWITMDQTSNTYTIKKIKNNLK